MILDELILYTSLQKDPLPEMLAPLMETDASGASVLRRDLPAESLRSKLFSLLRILSEAAGTYGFHGNLWHCYLVNLLVNDENSFSISCEGRGAVEGTVNDLALHDMGILQCLFSLDLAESAERAKVPELGLILDYHPTQIESHSYNSRIREVLCDLAGALGNVKDPGTMKALLEDFYRRFGVGRFGLHKSFRIVSGEEGPKIVPILNIKHVKLADLVGYESAKQKLTENTDAFVEGRKANNCLLFGDAGTGKSSCIKAIANEYFERGLRVIEIYKHQFRDLQAVIAAIKNRNYRFVIYMDDLSFEDFETEYKYLKAVIEGGLEKRPENVLIYATSNRRHLIRENFSDRDDDDKTGTDTVQEKLSLSFRFGVTIYFGKPDKNEYLEIVKTLAQREHTLLPEEELIAEALRWELSHGGRSGRTAQQFIDHLLSITGEDNGQ
ncbi:MAG: ATP-binding protein [Lachnospiraceae bacterium]|nr:ATP-binding protein [Lachnospiraceae bacterium]